MSKPKPSRHAPQEVDDCLAAQKPELSQTLKQLRAVIHAVAPDCAERVSF